MVLPVLPVIRLVRRALRFLSAPVARACFVAH